MVLHLKENMSGGAGIVKDPHHNSWKLEIPPGNHQTYRFAQLDDYQALARSQMRWNPPFSMCLTSRVSHRNVPGTWGFGLWNDPFSISLGLSGTSRRLPSLPNAIWFFHASPENYLSLRDDVPAQGMLAAVFASRAFPFPLFSTGLAALPLLSIPPAAIHIRRFLRNFILDDSARLYHDTTEWHMYALDWQTDHVSFMIDEKLCFQTEISPRVPMGLVIWIDNQYAAFTPDGKLSFGKLDHIDDVRLEIKDLMINQKCVYSESQLN